MSSILELRHLRSLQSLRESDSVSAAAKRLFLTQSALSHQIRVLEEYFDCALFERKTRPLRFTAIGERLLRLADVVLPEIDTAERDILQLTEGAAGELRVAVECHTCFDWLMPAMDSFRSLWPAVELDIVSGFHADPVGLLLSHRADLAIVSEAETVPDVAYAPLFACEMVGIAAKHHPLAEKEIWLPEDFLSDTLITYPVPEDMLDLYRKILLPAAIAPKRRNSELTIAIIQLVASRRGIAALPYWAVLPYLEKGYVVSSRITEQGLQSELYAAMRQEECDKRYLTHFCQIVRERTFAELPAVRLIEQ